MAVLRKEKKQSYTVIDNTVFMDNTLSYKAKGLLCQMLSLPDGWNFSVAGLTKLSADGRDAVAAGLDELKEAGYFRREQKRNNGKLAGVEYIISEVKNAENPFTGNPLTGKSLTGNPDQLNTNNNKLLNESNKKELYKSEFEDLWKMYPRKQGKDRALKSYVKARKEGTTFDEIKKGLLAYTQYIEQSHTDAQYIKMGSTFFSQKAWNDEYISVRPKSTNPFMELLQTGEY